MKSKRVDLRWSYVMLIVFAVTACIPRIVSNVGEADTQEGVLDSSETGQESILPALYQPTVTPENYTDVAVQSEAESLEQTLKLSIRV